MEFKKIAPNNWYRGSIEGIGVDELNKLLNFRDLMSFNIFTHIFLQAKTNRFSEKNFEKSIKLIKKSKFNKKNFINFLTSLLNWIKKIYPKEKKTLWSDYEDEKNYSTKENEIKKKIVSDFIYKNNLKQILDLGCNKGEFSFLALDNGAEYVVGYDFDFNSLNFCHEKSKMKKKNILALWSDFANPSPNQGWFQSERSGFFKRCNFDGVLALAFEHHLIISKNILIDDFFKWIVFTAPRGLIEFVPKNDQTVQLMLKLKKDIFHDYNHVAFRNNLEKYAKIVHEIKITDTGRTIYEFEKR